MIVIDLEALLEEGIVSPQQAQLIRGQARSALVSLVSTLLLVGGILATAAGLIAFLRDPLPVALAGAGFMAVGIAALALAPKLWRMLGQASALIGAGLLIGGGVVKALDLWAIGVAGAAFAGGGLCLGLLMILSLRATPVPLRFIVGFLAAAGVGLHIAGLYLVFREAEIGGLLRVMLNLYLTALLLGVGWRLDLRPVTALAIIPFAQALDLSRDYFDAFYALFPEEPTLTALQMAASLAAMFWLIRRGGWGEAVERHAMTFATMCLLVLNLCFFWGSIWGDEIGSTFGAVDGVFDLSKGLFAVVWIILLVGLAIWAARGLRRGFFNIAVTFATLHLYVQAFDRFAESPLAWVAGGLLAIPLAWGIWRLNQQFG